MLKLSHSAFAMLIALLMIAGLACSLTAPAQDLETATPQPTQVPKFTMTPTLIPTANVWNDCVVTATALNIRACPGVNCVIIGWLVAGQTVNAAPAADGWLTIMLADDRAGYIAARYCDSEKTKGQ